MTPTPATSTPRRAWLAALALVVLLLGLAFHEGLAGKASIDGRARLAYEDYLYHDAAPLPPTLTFTDPTPEVQIAPWNAWSGRWLRQGVLPLWQSENGLGSPLFANGQSPLFNPLKWPTVLAFGSGSQATAWYLVLRLLLATVGALLLAGSLGLGAPAGALLALAYALSASLTYRLPYQDVCIMLPWLLYAGQRLASDPGPRTMAGLALVTGLAGLTEHPETAIIMAGAAYVASFAARPSSARWLVGAALLGAGVAAVAVLPFAAFVREGTSYLFDPKGDFMRRDSAGWGFGVAAWTLVAHLFSATADANVVRFNSFVGTLALACAAFGWRAGPVRRMALTLAACALVIFLVCPPSTPFAGLPFTLKAYYATPLVTMALALLGAAGLEALEAADATAWKRVAMLCAAIAVIGLRGGLPPAWGAPGDHRAATIAAVVLALLWLTNPETLRWRTWLLVGVAGAELAFGARLAAPPATAFDYPNTPVTAFLKAQPGPFRYASGGMILLADTNQVHGLDSLEHVDAFHGRRYAQYMRALNADAGGATNFELLHATFQPDLLDLVNVRYLLAARGTRQGDRLEARLRQEPLHFMPVLADQNVQVYENRQVEPRARVLYAADHAPDAAARLVAAPTRWHDHVLLEGPTDLGQDEAPTPTTATIVARTPSSLTVEAAAKAPGWLVVSEGVYPGWSATVDGQPAAVEAADLAFRAVKLAPGAHRVTFRYAPPELPLAAAITLAALLACLLLLFGRRGAIIDGSWSNPERRQT
ncbi:MAG: hypothetical protein JWM80_2033 [Cyanobacteria bacterium RYN_339]|nr:hypothetical protein [Cyanobacteria bacterium RYN_339]